MASRALGSGHRSINGPDSGRPTSFSPRARELQFTLRSAAGRLGELLHLDVTNREWVSHLANPHRDLARQNIRVMDGGLLLAMITFCAP